MRDIIKMKSAPSTQTADLVLMDILECARRMSMTVFAVREMARSDKINFVWVGQKMLFSLPNRITKPKPRGLEVSSWLADDLQPYIQRCLLHPFHAFVEGEPRTAKELPVALDIEVVVPPVVNAAEVKPVVVAKPAGEVKS
jgi:hypothetical protein